MYRGPIPIYKLDDFLGNIEDESAHSSEIE
jgi:hypothetical protein